MTLPGALAVLITFMVIGIGGLFAFHPPDPTNQILTGLISTVSTVFVMVFSYYFGSSSGSKEKDDTVKQIALAAAPAANGDKPPAAPTKLTSVASG
jgi:hypothetical protein